MEVDFFAAFYEDILDYARELGYIDGEIMLSSKELLEIRSKITFNDIEKLLCKRKCRGEDILVADVPEEVRDLITSNVPLNVVIDRIKSLPPRIQGEILELYKERYPTIRWNFDYEDYIVIGVPDGITNEFVYEYKTTGNNWLLKWIKPVAMIQADIYGYFFRRKYKRIQIMTRNNGIIYTWYEKVDEKSALETLRRFTEVEKGIRIGNPPARWKCSKCEYKETCKIVH